jgi:hypothetical protein
MNVVVVVVGVVVVIGVVVVVVVVVVVGVVVEVDVVVAAQVARVLVSTNWTEELPRVIKGLTLQKPYGITPSAIVHATQPAEQPQLNAT